MDDVTCNISSSKDVVVLRRPTKEEIDEIAANMVSQVQTRGVVSRNEGGKDASIFVKKTDPKEPKTSKPKDGYDIKIKNVRKNGNPRKKMLQIFPRLKIKIKRRKERSYLML